MPKKYIDAVEDQQKNTPCKNEQHKDYMSDDSQGEISDRYEYRHGIYDGNQNVGLDKQNIITDNR